MIDNMIVAKTITTLRNSKNMTQQQFAAILGVSHQAVSKWETAAALPDLESMLDITRLFGITMEQLLSGNIPEFERETESEKETSDFLSSIMGKEAADALRKGLNDCRTACERIGEKLGKAVDDLVSDMDEEDDGTAESEEAEETERDQKMSLKSIIELAPFMSHEKIAEMVLACEEPMTPEALCAIAPFLNSGDLEQFIKLLPEGTFTMDCLIAIAPFLSREVLFRLAAANADKLDAKSLKALAPFLRKSMVDGLLDAMQKFASSDFVNGAKDFTVKAGKKLGEWSTEGVRVAKDVFGQFVDAAKATGAEFKAASSVDPEDAPRDDKDVPVDDLREKVLRAALDAGNWGYIKEHLTNVPSGELMSEICVKALNAFSYEDAIDMVLRALPYMNEESVDELVGLMAAGGFWDAVASAAPFAGTATADFVLYSAYEERTEVTLNAAKVYAKKASRETLTALTQKAVSENAWDFIAAVDSAI